MAFEARRALLVLAALSAAFAVWQRLDLGPEPFVTRFRDDACYAFCWARSVAEGAGPCVTPGVPTSGVHVGWTLPLVLLGRLVGPAAIPAIAQALGLACHAFTAVVVGRVAGVLAALVYVGNPWLLSEAQNGQETALACLATAALVATWRARWWAFAVGAVLALLARSDLFGVVAALALARDGLRVRALAAPALALAALLASNLAFAGSLWQDSAWPIPWLFDQHHARGLAPFASEWERWWWYLRPCLLGGPFAVPSFVLGGVLAAVAAGNVLRGLRGLVLLALVGLAAWFGAHDLGVPAVAAGLLAALPRAHRDGDGDFVGGDLRLARALLAGCAALVALHLLVRHYPRDYYFAPLGVAGAVALGMLLRARPRLGLVCVLAACVHQGWVATRPGERWPGQADMDLAGRHLRTVLGDGVEVGCFNSGIVTWHHRAVVNLDGVVNRPAFEALRASRLAEHLERLGVAWLCDTPVQFAAADPWPHCSGAWFHPDHRPPALALVARFDVPDADGGVAGTETFDLYALPGAARPSLPRVRDLGPAAGGAREVLWLGGAGVTLRAGPISDRDARVTVGRGIDGVAHVLRIPRRGEGAQGLFEDDDLEPLLRF